MSHLTTTEAAEMLGVTDRAMRNYAKKIGTKMGRDWFFDLDALKSFSLPRRGRPLEPKKNKRKTA